MAARAVNSAAWGAVAMTVAAAVDSAALVAAERMVVTVTVAAKVGVWAPARVAVRAVVVAVVMAVTRARAAMAELEMELVVPELRRSIP